MNRENNSIDELLIKYLLGEADAREHLTVQKWRDAKHENEKYFEGFRLIWEQSKYAESKSTIDENAAWERMKLRLQDTPAQSKPTKKIALSINTFMRVAAVLVVLLGGFWFYTMQSNRMIIVQSELTTKIENLPDGSVVTLNKNSSISYPKQFKGNTREISLSGEAFFNITPNKEMPFIIAANGVSIKVVGTSFNVKTAIEKTEVIVETGIVEVSKKENSVRLNPKEKAIVLKESAPVKDESKDALYNYYRTNEFVCNNTPLWRLVEVLNDAYGSHISIGNASVKNLPLTATFKNENLNDILNIISETLDVSISRNGTEIILQ